MLQRKTDAEGRRFQERWESGYMFLLQGEKPVCLLCYEAVSMMKEYNIRQHFDTKHGVKYAKCSLQEKKKKCQTIKRQAATAKNDAAVKASFIVAEGIAQA